MRHVLFILLCWFGINLQTSLSQTTIEMRIDGEIYLTDRHGTINPRAVISVPVGKRVVFYFVDGTKYNGIITESRVGNDEVKIFGKVIGNDNIVFGFGAKKSGEFGGALLNKELNKKYILEFNDNAKGFIFIFSGKVNEDLMII